ncbi:MAG: hypothetical protein LBQ19_04410, partial [Synergistaceae bacterium]|nr:hypothetical protein [Synergistaceae bacterium]
MRRIGKKRWLAVLVLALFMSQISLPIWEGTARAWAESVDVLNIRAPLKSEVGMDETDEVVGGSKG